MSNVKRTKHDKRLHIVVSDDASIKWLENQKNMSASLRLLIEQVANGNIDEDYVMFCAKQAPSPFRQSEVTNVPVTKELPETKPNQIETEFKDVENTEEQVLEQLPKEEEPSPQDSRINDRAEISHKESNKGKLTDEDWEEIEEKNNDTINRMMADLKRG